MSVGRSFCRFMYILMKGRDGILLCVGTTLGAAGPGADGGL